MTHEFELSEQIGLAATPEQVWDAIATGPGIDSWFMGRSEIEAREGGRGRTDMGGFVVESTVTACDPRKRFAYRGDPAPDGAFHAFEYLIEAREGGSTVLRFVHSGFLGDDWEAEYDALRKGDPMYLHKLAQYVRYFPGRYGAPISGFAGQRSDKERVWELYRAGLGLTDPVAVGDRVHLTPGGLTALDGEVTYVSEDFLGVRAADGFYSFIHGYQGALVIGHHVYGEPGQPAPDVKALQGAWQTWLAATFA
ncbi:SRPBCC domain-containing protein [Actinocrinis puniceicyclus]|uniref:SRPBCC domain-containing protein n=1 Tax=Actinocrinis puniceicyclus TaxID=977794 RepID=A0A8J7WPJ6_9ACTN|nr:SRPBCC domain-containing protein [Actinocrinis puniceicyclus]MBS2963184.1 SRPBCC domain-containing protein [Actinocrinis puniceicyclus]